MLNMRGRNGIREPQLVLREPDDLPLTSQPAATSLNALFMDGFLAFAALSLASAAF
jgi:hypothetical protein